MNWKIAMVVLAAAAPLAAQQPGKPDSMRHPMTEPGPMSGMMMEGPTMERMGPAMMKLMLYAPQHLLARTDALGLTADQIARLTTLRDGSKTAQNAAMSEARLHMGAIEQAANAVKPDTAALKTHFQAAHGAMGRAHWAMLASAAQARAVLTDAQRAKVQVWADSMEAWRQQHRRMMPPGPPH